jgi:nicotinate-nucleotide--dimethylbenzimidazole phosphoribosyltransferase
MPDGRRKQLQRDIRMAADPSSPSAPPAGPSTFDEISRLLTRLPTADAEAVAKTRAREAQLIKPAGALGRLEEIVEWLAGWQGRHPPRADHPRVCVFAANHGVAARGVSAYPAEVTAQMVANFIDGGAAVNQLCQMIDADLRVFEMTLETPTADFTVAPAMSEQDCVRAMAYGMMAVEPGIDVLCLGEMGIGNTTSAAALCLALFGGTAEDWTGPGTGVAGVQLAQKRKIVAAGVARHAAANPLKILQCLGGQEFAAIAGAVLAARLARIPVLLDGYASTAAAAILYKLSPDLLDHCMIAHCSAEPGHKRLLAAIGKTPLLDLGMRLGEASGAALAVALLRAAVACHNGMATFAEASVSAKIQN